MVRTWTRNLMAFRMPSNSVRARASLSIDTSRPCRNGRADGREVGIWAFACKAYDTLSRGKIAAMMQRTLIPWRAESTCADETCNRDLIWDKSVIAIAYRQAVTCVFCSS